MQDRIPIYPGRVKLTPVSGKENTYDMVRADQPTQEGTPLNKASLLKDTTAALYGLPNTAVPDDALSLLSRFQNGLGNEYVWAKTEKTVQKEIGTTGLMYLCSSNKGSSTVQYADACEVSSDGGVALKNPISVSVSTLVSYGADFLRGKYFLNPTHPGDTDWVKGIVYIHPTDGEVFESTYSSLCTRGGSLYIPYVKTAVLGYVNSPDQSSYPPAVSDGYTYTALGQLGDKTKIAMGSYTGTGTYGDRNPNSLTFEFEPKLVLVNDNYQYGLIAIKGSAGALAAANTMQQYVSWGSNTVSWYCNGTRLSANNQYNANGTTYNYIAIG